MRKNKDHIFKELGFTLAEILVSMGIFLVAVILIFVIYFTSQKFYQKSENRAELLQNGRVVLERLAREIRQTQKIVTVLPQTQTNPAMEIEFQDGHIPSPFAYLGSSYYYIRYFIATSADEVYRQYKVYCFDDCSSCSEFFQFNDMKMIDGASVYVHSCVLEEKIVAEYANQFQFWGDSAVNVSLTFQKLNETMNFQTSIFGRNF